MFDGGGEDGRRNFKASNEALIAITTENSSDIPSNHVSGFCNDRLVDLPPGCIPRGSVRLSNLPTFSGLADGS